MPGLIIKKVGRVDKKWSGDKKKSGRNRVTPTARFRPIGQIAGYNMPTSLIKIGDMGISNF
jgi:hypothetical protein